MKQRKGYKSLSKPCSSLCDASNPPMPKAPRIGKWQRWFLSLAPGDAVKLIFPWQDRKRHGGRRVTATVGRCKNSKIRLFRYRRLDGSRDSVKLRTWPGDCYTHGVPVGFELRYAPRRGYLLVREPNAGLTCRRRAA